MKSRRRCLLVAMWLTLPICVSLQLTTAFTSEPVLARSGLLTAALNLPGFLVIYLFAYRMDVPVLTLIGAADAVFYVPAIYAVLRWTEWRRRTRRQQRERARMVEVAATEEAVGTDARKMAL